MRSIVTDSYGVAMSDVGEFFGFLVFILAIAVMLLGISIFNQLEQVQRDVNDIRTLLLERRL